MCSKLDGANSPRYETEIVNFVSLIFRTTQKLTADQQNMSFWSQKYNVLVQNIAHYEIINQKHSADDVIFTSECIFSIIFGYFDSAFIFISNRFVWSKMNSKQLSAY